MNEQLVVKNFGPIKDATVDFKRVTVFIGPTGGGKSTLAKLKAIFGEGGPLIENVNLGDILAEYGINNYRENEYVIELSKKGRKIRILADIISYDSATLTSINTYNKTYNKKFSAEDVIPELQESLKNLSTSEADATLENMSEMWKVFARQYFLKGVLNMTIDTHYVPAERLFVSTLNSTWPSLIAAKVDLPKPLLDFAKAYLKAGSKINTLSVPFLEVEYEHINERGYINFKQSNHSLPINETASGIQSVTPMLVLLENLSHDTEQAQSFIIEEPELNLYPTAQQGLLNWLVEKCTKGENDLTITTHSPYILSHLNLLLYAYQVAEQHPDSRAEVAAIVPEASWINPKEFACYQVENGGVQSLVDDALGLIDNNELDALSGDAADAFDNLIRLSRAIPAK